MATNGKKKVAAVKLACLEGVKFANPQDLVATEKLPNLYECMCPQYTLKGTIRAPGKLTIRVDGSVYLATLELPTERVQTTMVIHTLCDLFEAIEAKLVSQEVTWSPTWKIRKKS